MSPPHLLRLLTKMLTLVAAAWLVSAPVGAQQTDRAARLDSALAVLHDGGLFDGSLAVSDASGRIVYRFSAGESEGEPVATSTSLYVASVSKAITAAAVLSLAAQGRLRLDGPVDQYIEMWPYPDVTVRQLLNQTSGIHFLTTIVAHADTTRPVTSRVVRDLVSRYHPDLAFRPGSAFAYNDANYSVLSWIIEAVAHLPFPDAVRELVFEPAGMRGASVGPTEDAGWLGEGGDALHASVEDLLAFDDAFWSGAIAPDSLVRIASAPTPLADGTSSRYVFGRFIRDNPRPLVGLWGEGADVKSGLWREREGGTSPGTTYAIEATNGGVYRTPILGVVMAIWNGEPFALPSARDIADVPEEILRRHVGTYDSPLGLLHITLEDGQLHLEPEGAGGSEPLIPSSETVFFFEHQDLTWEFVRSATGETIGLMLRGQPETLGHRVR